MSEDSQEALQLMLLKLETSLIGSTCIYQGEELALGDVQDIPLEKMQDPWGIEFSPIFLGRDTCRTPMVWQRNAPSGGFSDANDTWLPISQPHLERAALDQAAKTGSVYNELRAFLKWRKDQSAMMDANTIELVESGPEQIAFNRISDNQTLRCCFDFNDLTASFMEI